MNRVSALIKETTDNSLAPFHHVRTQQKYNLLMNQEAGPYQPLNLPEARFKCSMSPSQTTQKHSSLEKQTFNLTLMVLQVYCKSLDLCWAQLGAGLLHLQAWFLVAYWALSFKYVRTHMCLHSMNIYFKTHTEETADSQEKLFPWHYQKDSGQEHAMPFKAQGLN